MPNWCENRLNVSGQGRGWKSSGSMPRGIKNCCASTYLCRILKNSKTKIELPRRLMPCGMRSPMQWRLVL